MKYFISKLSPLSYKISSIRIQSFVGYSARHNGNCVGENDAFTRLKNKSHERASFGSFHSESVEDLIRLPEKEIYKKIMPYYYKLEQYIDKYNKNIVFGKDCIDAFQLAPYDFQTDTGFTFINHGAFGATLSPIMKICNMIREYCDSQPLRYYDRSLLPMIAYAMSFTASHIMHCSPHDLVPLVNVTAGLNCSINSLVRKSIHRCRDGDIQIQIVYLSFTYGSTKKIINQICDAANKHKWGSCAVNSHCIDLKLPIVDIKSDIISPIVDYYAQIPKDTNVIVVLDSITSNTAMTLPVLDISKQLRRKSEALSNSGSLSIIIDGAHSMFTQDIQIQDDFAGVVDYYITNTHKWFCNSKGSAIMWVHPQNHDVTIPPIISHGYSGSCDKNDHMLSSFAWDGCRDYSSLIAIPLVYRYWSQLNDQLALNAESKGLIKNSESDLSTGSCSIDLLPWNLVVSRNVALCMQVRNYLLELWKIDSDALPYKHFELMQHSMTLVPLPETLQRCMICMEETPSEAYLTNSVVKPKLMWTDKQSFQLQEYLFHDCGIEVPIKGIQGKGYVRLSVHMYNDMDDYYRLGKVIQNLCQ